MNNHPWIRCLPYGEIQLTDQNTDRYFAYLYTGNTLPYPAQYGIAYRVDCVGHYLHVTDLQLSLLMSTPLDVSKL